MKFRTWVLASSVRGVYSTGVATSTKTESKPDPEPTGGAASTNTESKTDREPTVGSSVTATIASVRVEPGTCDQLVTRAAMMSWICARVMPGTGLATLVTRHTPLSAIGVSTRPGGSVGPRLRPTIPASTTPRAASAIPVYVLPPA